MSEAKYIKLLEGLVRHYTKCSGDRSIRSNFLPKELEEIKMHDEAWLIKRIQEEDERIFKVLGERHGLATTFCAECYRNTYVGSRPSFQHQYKRTLCTDCGQDYIDFLKCLKCLD